MEESRSAWDVEEFSLISHNPAGLTAAAMAEALALQKMRMMMGFHGNSEQPWHQDADRTTSPSELDDTGTTGVSRLRA